MTEEYVGCQVSVEVAGGLGFYQGKVVAINTQRQTLTLTQVLHNGRPAQLSEVTINAGDVKDLKILSHTPGDAPPRTTKPTHPEASPVTAAPTQTLTSAQQPYTSQTQQPDHYKRPPPQQFQSQSQQFQSQPQQYQSQPQQFQSPQQPPQQYKSQPQQFQSPQQPPQQYKSQPQQFQSPQQPQQYKSQPQQFQSPQQYKSQPQQFQSPQQPPQQYQSQLSEPQPQQPSQPPPQQHTPKTAKVPPVGQGGVVGGAGTEMGQVRRKPRTSVGETLAHGSYQPFTGDGSGEWQRMTQPLPTDYNSPRRGDPTRTPNKKERQRRARNEATFGTSVDDDMMTTEFDFESNLALFDKRAVYEEIQSHKPDVVRQTVKENYRYDENVLPSKPLPERKIIVPTSGAAEVIYANDNGMLVPSVTSDLRAALLSTANQHGLTNSRQLEMIGRAATEIIMSISGCSHRLDPSNSQQPPVVVMLCGSHLQGAAGVNTARQLECQGVRTLVVTPPASSCTPTPLLLTHELQLYGLTSGQTMADPGSLPSTLDLIVDARLDHAGRAEEGGGGLAWLASTVAWASASRAPILALDPPSDLAALPSSPPPLPARVLMCVALPLAYTPTRGKVYLLSLPLPRDTFSAVGIKYVSPFGAKLVIPLHPYE